MNRLAEARRCSEFIKFNFSQKNVTIQEVKFLKNIDIYSQQNVDILSKLNNSSNIDGQESFYQPVNEVAIQDDCQLLFKQILQQNKKVNNIIQKQLQLLQNIKIDYYDIINNHAYTQDFEDTKDIKIKLGDLILLDEDYQTAKNIGIKNIKLEDFSSKELLNVSFLMFIYSSQEDFILNKLQELQFGMIILNPFKIEQ